MMVAGAEVEAVRRFARIRRVLGIVHFGWIHDDFSVKVAAAQTLVNFGNPRANTSEQLFEIII